MLFHILQTIFFLSFIFLNLLPCTASCRCHYDCDDNNPTTTDICLPRLRLCLYPSTHQTDSFRFSRLSDLIDRVNSEPLSVSAKLSVIRIAKDFLANVNPHRFLHLNFLKVDPVLALSQFASELNDSISNFQFHSRMIHIFQTMNDFHTVYLTPRPLNASFATLPASIKIYHDREDVTPNEKPRRKYLIDDFADTLMSPNTTLQRGSEVLTVDGKPVDVAIKRFGVAGYGSNFAARIANGVEYFSFRYLALDSVPLKQTVNIGYRNEDGTEHALDLEWLYLEMGDEEVVRVLTRLYAHLKPRSWEIEPQEKTKLVGFRDSFTAISLFRKRAEGREKITVSDGFKRFFEAEILQTKVGRVGRLQVMSFNSIKIMNVVKELKRILGMMPSRGLIIDLRSNGGGRGEFVRAVAEMVSGQTIEPQYTAVRSTKITNDFLNALNLSIDRFDRKFLQSFKPSVKRAFRTGEEFSGPVPASYMATFDRQERAYFGPVVTVVNALTYSAGDIYAAWQVDQRLSLLVGVDDNVGAGGASTATYSEYFEVSTGVLEPLPAGIEFTCSFARLYRGGKKSGVPLENFGVRPQVRYFYTRNDILNDDSDLLEFLAARVVGNGTG